MTIHTNPDFKLFQLSQQIIKETENRVVRIKPVWARLDFVPRHLIHPLAFFALGYAEFMGPIFKWSVISAVLLGIGWGLFPQHFPEKELIALFTFSLLIASFLVMFAVPSTYAFDTITTSQIISLADYIHDLGVDTDLKLKALGDNISLVADRVNSRVKFFLSFVAIAWGLCLFTINLFFNIALKLSQEQSSKAMISGLPSFFICFAILALSLFAVFCYKKANDAVIKRIHFSLSELKCRISGVSDNNQPCTPT
jgi:hypothetical protein